MENDHIKHILEQLESGQLTASDAYNQLKLAPFEDLGYAKVDHHREVRQGAPEVIYGASKTKEQMGGIIKNVNIEEYKPACLRIYIRIQKTPSGCFQAAVTPLNFRMVLLFVNDIIDYAFDRWSDMNQGSDDILPFISPQR